MIINGFSNLQIKLSNIRWLQLLKWKDLLLLFVINKKQITFFFWLDTSLTEYQVFFFLGSEKLWEMFWANRTVSVIIKYEYKKEKYYWWTVFKKYKYIHFCQTQLCYLVTHMTRFTNHTLNMWITTMVITQYMKQRSRWKDPSKPSSRTVYWEGMNGMSPDLYHSPWI